MCKLASEGGRCGCDTTEARQERRDVERLKHEYLNEVTPLFTGVINEAEITPIPTVEMLKTQQHEISELKNVITNYDNQETYSVVNGKTSLTLPDGTIIYSTTAQGLREQVFAIMETKVTTLGANIVSVASHKSVTEDQILASYVSKKAENLKRLDEIIAQKSNNEKELVASMPDEFVIFTAPYEKKYGIAMEHYRNEEDEEKIGRLKTAYDNWQKGEIEFNRIKDEISFETNFANKEFVELNKQHINAINETLHEIRDFGGELDIASNSSSKATKAVREAEKFFPKDWIDNSNQHSKETNLSLRVKDSITRAHYDDNAEQKYASSYAELVRKVVEHENFVPTPKHNKDGVWVKADSEGKVVDLYSDEYVTDTGATEYYSGWVVYKAEEFNALRHSRKKNKDGETVPTGAGWRKELVETVNPDGETVVKEKWRRPIQKKFTQQKKQAELTVQSSRTPYNTIPGFGIAVHELSHRMESSNPIIMHMENAFIKRRVTDVNGVEQKPVALLSLPGNEKKNYREDEITQPDGFVNAYMGKKYNTNHREVLSMSMQAIYDGDEGCFMGVGGHKKDTDTKNFVLGLLASV